MTVKKDGEDGATQVGKKKEEDINQVSFLLERINRAKAQDLA